MFFLAGSNIYQYTQIRKNAKEIAGLRKEQAEKIGGLRSEQAEKNARYENAIGFFKLATSLLNINSDFRMAIIDYYAKADTANVYDINGKYPGDYFRDYDKGKVGVFTR